MKRKSSFLLTVLAALVMALPAAALEPRTFYSADKTKSFDATLAGFDAKKKVVTVAFSSGKKKSFPLKVLSEKCQQYVLSHADLMVIAKSVRLSFEEVKEKRGDDATATGYAIEVNNSSDNQIEDVTLKYTLHYRQGDLKKGGTEARTKSGKLSTGKLYSHDALTLKTGKVDIVRKKVPPSGG